MFEMEKAVMEETKLSTPAFADVKLSTPAFADVKLSTPAFADVMLSTPAEAETGIFDETQSRMETVHEIPEFAPSMEVQAGLIREEFLRIPEIQYENWKELTVEERVATMNALEQHVARIAHRDPITVLSEDLEYPIMGYYNNQDKIMVVSEISVGDDSYEAYVKALTTLFHEGRHAYQDYNLEVCRVEQSDELVAAWAVNNNGLGYDNGERLIFKTRGIMHYFTQPVEVDARVFAETVIMELEL